MSFRAPCSSPESPARSRGLSSRGHAVAVAGCRSGDGSAEARSRAAEKLGASACRRRARRELPPGATAGLRPTIVESWRRSLATGLDPTDLLAPIEADESEVLERWFEHPLGSLTHVLTEQLRQVAEESRSVVVVTDASGLVLHRVGDEWLKERAAEMNLVEGARYSEAADGTNGIGTALAADHAVPGVRFRALQRAPSRVDLLRRSGARPGVRPRRSD